MFSGAATGEMPWWYAWIRAADRLGVPVWVLLDEATYGRRTPRPPGVPRYPFVRLWMQRALIAEQAENQAKQILTRKSQADQRRSQERTSRPRTKARA